MKEDLFGTSGLITRRFFDIGVMFGGATGLTVILLLLGSIHQSLGLVESIAVVSCLFYLFWVLIISVLAISKISTLDREPSIHLAWACFKVGFALSLKCVWWSPNFTVYMISHAFENKAKPRIREFAAGFADRIVRRQLSVA